MAYLVRKDGRFSVDYEPSFSGRRRVQSWLAGRALAPPPLQNRVCGRIGGQRVALAATITENEGPLGKML